MKKLIYLTAITSLIISSLALAPTASAFFWTHLKSPYPTPKTLPHNITSLGTVESCPKAPPAIHDMEYVSIYSDRSHGVSIIDKKAQIKYKAQTAPIRKYESQIYRWIEQALNGTSKDGRPITCAMEWFVSWSNHDALLHGKTTFQGKATRKWTLAVLSTQYLQIKNLKGLDSKKKQRIEQWLKRLGNEVINNYDLNPERTSRNNNHMYWAAWSVMITGVAINDKKFYRWGEHHYTKALQQIQPDGTLPLELARQGKAFNYHVFAAAPLIMMAETMKRNGKHPYKNGQLHRLINFILDDLKNDQKKTIEVTKVKQDIEGTITSGQLAWLEAYNARFPDARISPWLNKLQPMVQRRLGGNLTRLYKTNPKQP